VLIVTAASDVLGWAVLAFTIIPLGDAITILRARGPWRGAVGIHGATVAVMLVGSTRLLGA